MNQTVVDLFCGAGGESQGIHWAAAQSFPKDYKFTGTKTEVVKQIGNAVCPMMAKALVEAGGMK